ncbi:MAG TPA: polyhydroxyalkanoate synthesis regulator DNA-binding domain-containing protein [Anaerolineae bacterium]|nr:polyhydroxyalkanoate synthesis regulator DNA-binding domain-containing protein [Anaerolineae bacterium]
MSTIIKRYPNRKLYNTETKKYITLDGLAQLIREGEEIEVVDNVSGEDLTAVTLSQIIFEQEKKQGGFLPQSVLAGLIQSGGSRLGAIRRTLSAPLDLFRQVDTEIERRVQQLIHHGDLKPDEGVRLRDKLLGLSRWGTDSAEEDALANLDEEEIAAVLQKHGLPKKTDIDQLMAQLDELASKLETLELNQNEETNSP